MKSRKRLSVFLAASMTLSAFAPVAFGAELTTEQKWQALVDAGIFDADGTGQGAQLDANMTRAQFTKVIVKLLGLQEVSGTPSFDDVKGHWAAGYIEAAKRAGLVDGVSDNPPLFAPDNEVTLEQLAKLVVEALDLEQSTDAVSGKVSDWAKGYVAAAVKAGLLPASGDYTVPAKREVLVTATYQAREIEKAKTALTIDSLTAVGAKKLQVKFNKAVDDTSKASFAVTRSSNTVVVDSVAWNADKTAAVLTLSSKLIAATYEVTVSGLTDQPLKKSIAAEDEKVSKIEFLSDRAAIVDPSTNQQIEVGYKVSNQYGEDISNITSLVASATFGSANPNAGTLTITLSPPNTFSIDQKVAATLIHTSTGVSATQTLTVSPVARVSDVSILKLYNADNKTLTADSTPSDFKLVIEAKDQYGRAVTNTAKLNSEILVSVSNTSVASVDSYDASQNTAHFTTETIDGSNKTVLALAGPLSAGSTTITLIAKNTGKSATFVVQVGQGVKTDNVAFGEVKGGIVAAGETVQIVVNATDMNGNLITDPNVLNDSNKGLTISFTPTISSYAFKKSGNEVVLEFTAPNAAGTVTVTALSKTAKYAVKTIDVKAAAEPKVITGLDADVSKLILKNASLEIKAANLRVEDQYGRVMSDSAFDNQLNGSASPAANKYRVVVSGGGGAVTVGSNVYIYQAGDTNEKVTFTGASKGSSTFTFTLQKYDGSAWNDVAGSQANVTLQVVELGDLKSFGVEDLGTVFGGANADSDYFKSISVYGLTADNKKVTLPSTEYNWIPTTLCQKTSGQLDCSGVTFASNENEKSGTLSVVINNTGDVIEKSFKVSNVAPTVDKLEIRKNGSAVTSVSLQISAIGNELKLDDIIGAGYEVYIADQYGVQATVDSSTGVATFRDVPQTLAPTPRLVFTANNTGGSIVDNGLTSAELQKPSGGWTAWKTVDVTIIYGSKSVKVTVTLTP